jgi:hypothetical protein
MVDSRVDLSGGPKSVNILLKNSTLAGILAEREGFEPPIAFRLCLISSQVHSTGLCHLSAFGRQPLLRPEQRHRIRLYEDIVSSAPGRGADPGAGIPPTLLTDSD